jgi:hypothetical protein
MAYVDAIIHISDVPALIQWFAAHAPSKLDWTEEEGQEPQPVGFKAFAGTPMRQSGVEALTYVRMTEADAATYRGHPLTTVLAEAAFTGDPAETADLVYAALADDAAALATYQSIYPETDPFRIGQMG